MPTATGRKRKGGSNDGDDQSNSTASSSISSPRTKSQKKTGRGDQEDDQSISTTASAPTPTRKSTRNRSKDKQVEEPQMKKGDNVAKKTVSKVATTHNNASDNRPRKNERGDDNRETRPPGEDTPTKLSAGHGDDVLLAPKTPKSMLTKVHSSPMSNDGEENLTLDKTYEYVDSTSGEHEQKIHPTMFALLVYSEVTKDDTIRFGIPNGNHNRYQRPVVNEITYNAVNNPVGRTRSHHNKMGDDMIGFLIPNEKVRSK